MNCCFAPDADLAFASEEVLEQEQTRLLNEHLRYCRRHSRFYAGLPNRELALAELATLPTTSREDLSHHNDDFTAVDQTAIADISFTSGTTGMPCRFIYTRDDLERLAVNDAVGFRGTGMRPGDIVLLTCTIDRCFIAGLAYYSGVLKLGATGIRNGLNTLESHAEIISRQRPSAIVGVPSFLAKLGEFLWREHIPADHVKRLICIGEPLRDRQMQLTPLGQRLDKYWPNRAYSTYATSEIGTSFTECAERCGGHPPAELAIVEILDDDGRVLPDGEVGEVTVTPLQVTGMPLIRFRTGDISFIIPGKCACGRNTPRLGPILGRKAQMLKIRGTMVFPNAFFSVLDEMDEVEEYYIEVSGSGLSDEVSIHVAGKSPELDVATIASRIHTRTRIRIPVLQVSPGEAQQRVFGSSRKPRRFFDYRQSVQSPSVAE